MTKNGKIQNCSKPPDMMRRLLGKTNLGAVKKCLFKNEKTIEEEEILISWYSWVEISSMKPCLRLTEKNKNNPYGKNPSEKLVFK